MKISAVVVTYNRLNLLKECLKCLLNQFYELDNIIIVNNNSSDGTTSYLSKLQNEKLIVVNTSKNLGGAGGFSLGINTAYEKTNSKYFWVMDDDTMPTSSALQNMMNKAKQIHYNFGFLCSNVRWWKNDSVALTNIPTPARDWNSPIINGLVKVISASFVSVLFSREYVYKLGLPISKMFIWGDDVDFTRRISIDNPRSYFVTNSIVLHHSNNNVCYNIINSPRITFYIYGIRNGIYHELKYEKFRKLIKQLLKDCFILFKIPFYSKNKRIKRILVMIIGIFSGFVFNPKIHFPSEKFMSRYIRNIKWKNNN